MCGVVFCLKWWLHFSLCGVFHCKGTCPTNLIPHRAYHDIKGPKKGGKRWCCEAETTKLLVMFFAMLIEGDYFRGMTIGCI